MANVEQALAQWDGKAIEQMQLLFDQYHTQQGFVQQLISFLQKEETQLGASWLLKACLDKEVSLNASQVDQVLLCLLNAHSWQTKLHILQSLPHMVLSKKQAEFIYPILRQGLSAENKFVRAWSYNGMYELSCQHAKYLKETKQYFALALEDEAPSVKARLRNIMKSKLFD